LFYFIFQVVFPNKIENRTKGKKGICAYNKEYETNSMKQHAKGKTFGSFMYIYVKHKFFKVKALGSSQHQNDDGKVLLFFKRCLKMAPCSIYAFFGSPNLYKK
jgi:hypothetical protein